MTRLNEYDQPIGTPVPIWGARPLPPHKAIEGRIFRLEPINAKSHGAELYAALTGAPDNRPWTYLFTEPIANQHDCMVYLESMQADKDPMFFAVVDSKTQRAVGWSPAYLPDCPPQGKEAAVPTTSKRLTP